MSKKTELINLFTEYKSRYERAQAQVTEINNSPAYTETGKEEAIKKVMEEFTPTAQLYHDRAVVLIDAALDALAEKWKKSSAGKLKDSGYQAGLANVIKMLEMGVTVGEDDILNIIDTYRSDFNALATIKKILQKSNEEILQRHAALVPTDNRGRNKELLIELKGNVEEFINGSTLRVVSRSWNAFNQGLTSVSMSMSSMAEFVQENLGDDLELLS